MGSILQKVLPIAGTVLGGIFGGPAGAAIGGGIGGLATSGSKRGGGLFDPTQQTYSQYYPSFIDLLSQGPQGQAASHMRDTIMRQIAPIVMGQQQAPDIQQRIQQGFNLGQQRSRIPLELINPMAAGGLASAGSSRPTRGRMLKKVNSANVES